MLNAFEAIQSSLDDHKKFFKVLSRLFNIVSSKDYIPLYDVDLKTYSPLMTEEDIGEDIVYPAPTNEVQFQLDMFEQITMRLQTVCLLIEKQMVLKHDEKNSVNEQLMDDNITVKELIYRADKIYREYHDKWEDFYSSGEQEHSSDIVINYQDIRFFYAELEDGCVNEELLSESNDFLLEEIKELRLDYAQACENIVGGQLSRAADLIDEARTIYKAIDDAVLKGDESERDFAEDSLYKAAQLLLPIKKDIRNIERFLGKIFDMDPDMELTGEFATKIFVPAPLTFNI